MKAIEFVKKFGVERAKQMVNADDSVHALVFATTKVSFLDLKRLVESHELVEKVGGLENAKTFDKDCMYCITHLTDLDSLKQAIADVESCQ